jgi:hypothetical protein
MKWRDGIVDVVAKDDVGETDGGLVPLLLVDQLCAVEPYGKEQQDAQSAKEDLQLPDVSELDPPIQT